MTSSEFSHWLALSRIEPWGQDRADVMLAALRQTVAIGYSDPKRKIPPIEQFILRWTSSIGAASRRAVQSAESIYRCLFGVAEKFGEVIYSSPKEDGK